MRSRIWNCIFYINHDKLRLHGHFKAQRLNKCTYTGVPIVGNNIVNCTRRRALIDMPACRVRFVNESFFGRVGSYQSVKHDLELLNESVEQSLSLELNRSVQLSTHWTEKRKVCFEQARFVMDPEPMSELIWIVPRIWLRAGRKLSHAHFKSQIIEMLQNKLVLSTHIRNKGVLKWIAWQNIFSQGMNYRLLLKYKPM